MENFEFHVSGKEGTPGAIGDSKITVRGSSNSLGSAIGAHMLASDGCFQVVASALAVYMAERKMVEEDRFVLFYQISRVSEELMEQRRKSEGGN